MLIRAILVRSAETTLKNSNVFSYIQTNVIQIQDVMRKICQNCKENLAIFYNVFSCASRLHVTDARAIALLRLVSGLDAPDLIIRPIPTCVPTGKSTNCTIRFGSGPTQAWKWVTEIVVLMNKQIFNVEASSLATIVIALFYLSNNL